MFFSGKILKVMLVGIFGVWVLAVFLLLQLPSGRMYVGFLDIGQGDSIFVKTPQNHQILIDGGPQNFVLEELNEVMPFWDKSIDFLVLTHPDADHLSGLVEVLKNYEVENVLMTGISAGSDLYEEFLKELNSQGVRIFLAESAVDFRFGEVFMDVLFPLESLAGAEVENKNDSSVAVKIVYENHEILLTGDLEEAEMELIGSGVDLSADIFKAGHHGSRTSSSEELLRLVQPEIVVIQCGFENSFGHPHAEALRNFERVGVERVYRTDLEGRVEFWF